MGKRVPKVLNPFIAMVHFAIRHLPFKLSMSFMGVFMGIGGPIFIKSNNMRRNIREVFPDLDEPAIGALIKKILANFGRHITEILHITSFRDGAHGLRIDYTTPDGASFDWAGPAVFVGAHVGSWELFPLVFNQNDQPMTVIYSPNEHSILDNFLMHQRIQTGAKYVEKNSSLKPCIQALGRGESVALLVDQRVRQGVDVSFFGRRTPISRFPALLATKFDCPIVPFEVVRIKSGHLQIVFQNAIVPNGAKGPQVEFRMTQEIACQIQNSIVRNAETWFCTKLRWRPEDLAKLASQPVLPNPYQ